MRRVALRRLLALLLVLLLLAPARAATLELGEPIVMRGAAVAETPNGLVGSTASFTITVARNGSGHVFLDTFPLTQVDMQGSARLAARVASQVAGEDLSALDVFFVIRSGSVQIGGPSAGATLAVGTIAAMNGWSVAPDVLMTGTIAPDGTIGPVGGVPEKAQAAANAGMRRFLFPAGEEFVVLSSQPGVVIDLVAYCRDTLSIECVPVEDVYEAVENMTDHAFVRPPVSGEVTGDAFRQRLAPLAAELLAAAESLVGEATQALDGVPEGAAREAIAAELEDARGTRDRARSAYDNETFYTAASLSFQTSIAAHDARDRARVAKAADPVAAAYAALNESAALIDDVLAEVSASEASDTAAFESVGAAQVRIMEAERRLTNARALLAGPRAMDLTAAVYESAYAAERAKTARWWLGLGKEAPPGTPVPREGLAELARDAITTSTEEVAYVEAVFGTEGVAIVALDPARRLLVDAEAAIDRGFLAAALMMAMEAQVRASDVLLITTFGGAVPNERLDAARESAARAIQSARARGVEPLLAQSQYEFGLSLEDAGQRLSMMGYSRVLANIAGLPGLFGASHTTSETRFQRLPDALGVAPVWLPVAFGVGMALGVGLGLTAMSPAKRKADAQRAPRPAAEEPRAPDWEW